MAKASGAELELDLVWRSLYSDQSYQLELRTMYLLIEVDIESDKMAHVHPTR